MKKLPIWMTTVTPASRILALMLFILLPFGFFYIGVEVGRNEISSTIVYVNSVDDKNSAVVTPSPTSQVTSTPVATDPMANWKTFNDATYDISFSFPPDWNVTESTTDNNSSGFTCSAFPWFFKDVKKCVNDVARAPALTISSTASKNLAQDTILIMPTVGGEDATGCNQSVTVCTSPQKQIVINGKTYSVQEAKRGDMYDGKVPAYTTSDAVTAANSVPAGSKSIFKVISISYNAQNTANYNVMVKIMQSIKQNS